MNEFLVMFFCFDVQNDKNDNEKIIPVSLLSEVQTSAKKRKKSNIKNYNQLIWRNLWRRLWRNIL